MHARRHVQFSNVRAGGIELFKPGDFGAGLRYNYCCGIPVLYARSRDRKRDEQSRRINDKVAFSPRDLLGCIESAVPSLWRRAVSIPCQRLPLSAYTSIPCVRAIVHSAGLASARTHSPRLSARTLCRFPTRAGMSRVIAAKIVLCVGRRNKHSRAPAGCSVRAWRVGPGSVRTSQRPNPIPFPSDWYCTVTRPCGDGQPYRTSTIRCYCWLPESLPVKSKLFESVVFFFSKSLIFNTSNRFSQLFATGQAFAGLISYVSFPKICSPCKD